MTKILVFAGSSSKASLNRKMAAAASTILNELGAETLHIELSDYDMPIYNADWERENGLPQAAIELKKLFIDCDGWCIACPEYNSSITPLLKNTLDWVSRKETEDEPALAAYQNGVLALLSASPGMLGGVRALSTVRAIFENIGTIVLPGHVILPKAHEAFDESGHLINERKRASITKLMENLVRVSSALKQ